MKKVGILLLVLVAILGGCVFVGIIGETEDPVDNSASGTAPTDVAVDRKIDVELAEFTWDGDRYAGALIKNNSEKQIGELEIQFLFYDADGTILGTATDGHDAILPGSTVTAFVSNLDVPQNYDHVDYKLSVDAEANGGYKNHTANIGIETNIGEDCVILQFTNNADVDIEELEYSVVFYKDGKVTGMGFGIDVYDITVGETVIEEYSSWGVDFDSYVVYINQAHTFGW